MGYTIEDFVDREEELSILWKAAQGLSTRRVIALCGEGGVGKTYLLKQFHAQCVTEGFSCAYFTLDRFENPDYISLVLRLWEQLPLGDLGLLRQKLAESAVATTRETLAALTSSAAPPVGRTAAPSANADGVFPPTELRPGRPADGAHFYGETTVQGDIVAGNKILYGDEIHNFYVQIVQPDDPRVQSRVQAEVTAFMRERLVALSKVSRVILLFSQWDAVTKDAAMGRWLQDNLLNWILDGEIPNAMVVLASVQGPQFGRLPGLVEWVHLGSLPDDAAREYWVEKCHLPAEHVPTVIEITSGLPQALYLAAESYRRVGSQAFSSMRPPDRSPHPASITARVTEAFLEATSSPLADAVRLGAICHWFDKALLSRLCGAQPNFPGTLEGLSRFRFVQVDDEGRFRYDADLRRYLLTWWWHTDNRERYIEASKIACDYFSSSSGATTLRERQAYELEMLYHLVVIDEPRGIRELNERFETACELYQLDVAEQLVAGVFELTGFLSKQGEVWLKYWQARLDLINHREAGEEAAISGLAEQAADPFLQALATWTLGRIRLKQHRWSEAVRLYKASLRDLQKVDAPAFVVRIILGLAETYADLADHCGGFQVEYERSASTLGLLLDRIQHLPFLSYEWLVRRVSLLPNWYFGTNYQDWIIAYLLLRATHWYRQAEKQLHRLPGQYEYLLARVRLALADLEHQLGRWSRAQRRYSELLDSLEAGRVAPSDYRMAQVLLARGRADLKEGQLDRAMAELSSAARTYRLVHDNHSLSHAAALLGRAYSAIERPVEAVGSYLESAEACKRSGNGLLLTRTIWALEDLRENASLPDPVSAEIHAVLEKTPERSYIARFPATLLRSYRRLAVIGALPLTGIFAFVIALLTILALAIVESNVMGVRVGASEGLGLTDILVLVAFALIPVPLALWAYRLVYTFLGIAVVRLLGHRLVPIEREQPVRITTDAVGLTRQDTGTGDRITIPWSSVQAFVSVDYRQWQRLIDLLSSTVFQLNSRAVVTLDGVTSGYDHLKRDIARRLRDSGAFITEQKLEFVVFDFSWILVSLVACVVFTLGMSMSDKLVHFGAARIAGPMAGQSIRLLLTSLAFTFLPTFTLVFPALTLWRLVSHRLAVRGRLPRRIQVIPTWLLFLGALFFTIVVILWIAMSLRLAGP